MSYICDICGKKPIAGHRISHSHHRTKRWWRPNIKCVRSRVGKAVKRLKVCTSCLSAGKVLKA